MKFPVDIELDDNAQYLITFPDIPEAATAADSRAEALEMAVDALESAIDLYFDEKKPVPLPALIKKGRGYVELPGTAVAKVLLHNEMLALGVKKAELARRMKMAPPNVERIFHAKHGTRLETLEAAFAALGKKLEITVKPHST
jgi:antitoxin HicB